MGRLALPAQQADDSRPADSRFDLQTERAEALSYERGGAMFLEPDLGMGMQLPQPGK